ncbi:MAG TPA: N-acetylmuramoyl-L-alanine amidase, partial [bacterium]|nr:N-acetylmuramoyl-L-alanine amidase [bacterium]
LKRRAEIANNANSKLFISIHCNAHKNKRVSGMEIYFLSEAKTESAQRVADLENASIQFEDNPGYYNNILDIHQKILNDMKSNVFLKESQDICKLVLDSSTSSTRQINRGVKQAGFYVMLGTQATMPSILFEIGYISNSKEEKILKRVSHHKRVAQAIYDAIIEFKRRAERDIISKGN